MFFEPRHGMRPAPLKHNPFNAVVCPRPIGWISSISADGRCNLAPFSYFNGVSADPPYVMFAPNAKSADDIKDTYRNIVEVPEFVANVVSENDAVAMNQSSKPYPHGVDEFEACGIAKAASQVVRPPRVAAAKVAMECRVYQVVHLPKGDDGRESHVVIAEVVGMHIDDSLIVDGRVDETRWAPLSRLGYMNYGTLGRVFEMFRPD